MITVGLRALLPRSLKLFLHRVMCQDPLAAKEQQSLHRQGKGRGKQGQPVLGWYRSWNIRVVPSAAEGSTFGGDHSQGVQGGQ